MPENVTVLVSGQQIAQALDEYKLTQSVNDHHVLEVSIYALDRDSHSGLFEGRDEHLGFLGKPISITVETDDVPGESAPISYEFVGIVTEVGFDHNPEGLYHFKLLAHSPTISLDKVRRNRLFHNVKASDIIQEILGEYSITVGSISATSTTFEYCVQYRETDWSLIQRLAAAAGMFAYYDGSKFQVTKAKSQGSVPSSTWGADLRSFSMRVGSATEKFTAQVYDSANKEAIAGVTPGSLRTSLSGLAKNAHEVSKEVFTNASFVPGLNPDSQKTLDDTLETVRESSMGQAIPCKGSLRSRPAVAGQCIDIEGVGVLNGRYFIRTSEHSWARGDFNVNFTCCPLEAAFPARRYRREPFTDLQAALVVDTDDTEGLGRVKISFFWNDGTTPAQPEKWVRVMTPHSGNERGFFCLPEVDDEVLVAFENGDPNRPVIIGSMYNGKDLPPVNHPAGFSGADNDLKLFRTKSDNEIYFKDVDGQEMIGIVQKDGKNLITLSMDGPTITIQSEGDISIKGKSIALESDSGDITLTSGGALKAESTADTEIKAGGNLKAEGSMNADVKAGVAAKVTGATVNVEGSAQTVVKGGVVQIN